MKVDFNFQSIFKYLMSFSTLFIVGFLTMDSAINQNIKGLIYLGGVLIVSIIGIIFKNIFTKGQPDGYNVEECQLFKGLPALIAAYSMPDLNSMILSFTVMYVIMPMIHGGVPVNAILIIIMSIFTIGNSISLYLGKCNKLIDLIVGNILGAGIGVAYFFLFWASGNKNLLFGNSLDSNNVICNRPAKQTFKCAVYKNGQVVKNL